MNLKHPRFVLIAVFLLFFGPVLLAVMMRSEWWDFTPGGTSNLGDLVQPPVPLDLAGVEWVYPGDGGTAQAWTVLFPLPKDCSHDCLRTVAGLRQLHLATGRHRERIAIVVLAEHALDGAILDELARVYPDLHIGNDARGVAAGALGMVDAPDGATRGAFGDGRAFLLDPPGNIILSYAQGFDPGHINKDLKRLLAWSAQDENQ